MNKPLQFEAARESHKYPRINRVDSRHSRAARIGLCVFRVFRGFIPALAVFAGVGAACAEVPVLWLAQPAAKWDEALPVGNGRLGAMVFGAPQDERIQFNEDTLWTGHPHDYVRAGSHEALLEVQRLLAAGKTEEATKVARTRMLSDPVRQKAYQPFGDIRLHFDGHENVTAYRRELNLDSAIIRTTYTSSGTTYTEDVFASYPDQVIVVHLTANHRGALTFDVRLDSPHKDSRTVVELQPSSLEGAAPSAPSVAEPSLRREAGRTLNAVRSPAFRRNSEDSQSGESGGHLIAGLQAPTLVLTGRVEADGLRFEAQLRVLASGGAVRAAANELRIDHADSVVLLLTAATSFRNFEDISADPHERVERTLAGIAIGRRPAPARVASNTTTRASAALQSEDEASAQGTLYATLRARHTTDYRALFRRVSIDLGRTPADQLPTDERVRRVKAAGGIDADPALAALEFQYGRYLLISSSRPGSQPANLQGIWNELLSPPWESKWTTNINVEMNYWPAEVTNLGECHEPLFDLINDLTISGGRTAREMYGARGWVLNHNTDLWRGTAPINNFDGIWPTGGAWLCYHLWEHWLFSHDRTFLADRAYPAMRGASLFFVDSLQRDPKTGWLVTTPSFSPEQGSMTIGPTMDNQLIRALWENTIAAARELGVDAEFVAQLQRLLPQLPPNQIGRYGQLQEWLTDIDRPNNNHRHMSPLWALYPGADITPADPKIFDAAKLLLKWRGDGSTGWSYAWRVPLWARVGDAEMAYRQLSLLLAKRTLSNLFDLCGPFQIDGNFGATAGVAEMLLQSYQRTPEPTDAVIIDLLPALPKEWPTGSVTGLRGRDGFAIDMEWHDGKLTRAVVHSGLGLPCVVRYGGATIQLHIHAGESVTLGRDLHVTTL